jgi:TonB family protein
MIHRKSVLVAILVCFVAGLGAATAEAGDPVPYDKETMREPQKIKHVNPVYPAEAKKEGVQGTVVLQALIAEDGTVQQTSVLEGEDARLVNAAREAVGQWLFEPMRDEDGKPIAVLFTVTIRFALS